MKKIFGFGLICLLLFLVACGGSKSFNEFAPAATAAFVVEEAEPMMAPTSEAVLAVEDETIAEVPAGADTVSDSRVIPNQQSERLIIKTADMSITVEQTDQSVEAATNITINAGGYILSQQVWEQNGFRYATMRVGVPVDSFEQVMRSFRTLGMVTSENASGEDVTEEFVDLESRLENLRITQERLQTFLSQATKIEDVIELNQELSRVEEEINVIEGRMNYLVNRAAFSTIALSLNPLIPTPTPSPTATPTPIPTAESWRPGDTAQIAVVQLQEGAQDTADFFIYNGIVCGPWLLLFGLLGLVGWRIGRRLRLFNRQ